MGTLVIYAVLDSTHNNWRGLKIRVKLDTFHMYTLKMAFFSTLEAQLTQSNS